MTTRKQDLYIAKLAKQVGRLDDMMEIMEKVALTTVAEKKELTIEERELLFEAYGNAILSRCTVMKNISSIKKEEIELRHRNNVNSILIFRQQLEDDLSLICKNIFSTIDSMLLRAAHKAESKVFYLHMKGNFHRYIIHVMDGSDVQDIAHKSFSCYKAAQDIAQEELTPLNPIRLKLALDFSTFHYDILKSPHMACTIANQACEDATRDMAAQWSIIKVLRDKIDSWGSGEAR